MNANNTLLFLCTGNYYRSRFAEILFNSLALQSQLPWQADSRGLALERGMHNVGPISSHALSRLQELGIQICHAARLPLTAQDHDFANAQHVIAVKEAEHRPLMDARFPRWTSQVEFWHIHDVDCATPAEALIELEFEVRALAHRLARQNASLARSETAE